MTALDRYGRARRLVLTVEERFWIKVRVGTLDECWPWLFGLNPNGYGWFRPFKDRNPITSNRFVCYLAFGLDLYPAISASRPGQPQALHTCDNRPCCNPLHLYVGTPFQNTADMIARGREHFPLRDRPGFAAELGRMGRTS